jgi:GntR family transcriptional regulator, transcriptional repressor for pyruvate dehydrogenase complex
MGNERVSGREPFRIRPIRQVDVYREVLGQLERLVGSLRPGDRIGSERELAEQLRVSRVSVREALRTLEAMGRVEIRRNAGCFVIDPEGTLPPDRLRAGMAVDAEFLQWLSELRAALDAKAVELAARRGKLDLAPLRGLLEQTGAELAGSEGADTSMDMRFEAVLARMAGNPLLIRLQATVHRLWAEAWSEAGLAAGDRREFHREHEAILAALERGEGQRAVRLMNEHVDRTVPTEA